MSKPSNSPGWGIIHVNKLIHSLVHFAGEQGLICLDNEEDAIQDFVANQKVDVDSLRDCARVAQCIAVAWWLRGLYLNGVVTGKVRVYGGVHYISLAGRAAIELIEEGEPEATTKDNDLPWY